MRHSNMVVLGLLLGCLFLFGCSSTNYKAVGYVDGEAGVQVLAGSPGEERPVTQPYVIKGQATVTAQYPQTPHLNVMLEPDATISVQNGPAGQPARGSGAVLENGNVVVQRR